MSKKWIREIVGYGMLLFATVVLSQTVICQSVIAAETDFDTVVSVQNALNDAGYECGAADGVAGSKTEAAIQQYQQNHGQIADGEIDDMLLFLLGISSGTDISMDGVSGDTEFATADSQLSLVGYSLGRDYEDKEALILYFDYTNLSSSASFTLLDYSLQIYQNGVSRDMAFPPYQQNEDWEDGNNNLSKNIKDGATLRVAAGYELENILDSVEVEISELVKFDNPWTFTIDFKNDEK